MSMSEINAMIEANPMLDRQRDIRATGIPASVINSLTGKGIDTVGDLADSDAFRAIASGRYNIDAVREVNGIPISALQWLLDEITLQSSELCVG